MKRSLIQSVLLFPLLANVAWADGFQSRLGAHVDAYVTAHQLAKREVAVSGKPGVKRVFVPILTDHHSQDFENRFSRANGAVLWGQWAQYDMYSHLIFEPSHHYFRDSINGEYQTTKKPTTETTRNLYNRYIAMELEPNHITELETHLNTVNRPSTWAQRNPGRQMCFPAGGKCMWWMTNAETGHGENLAQTLGVKRSAAPENMRNRMMHHGNQRVSVVGVKVPTLEAFHAMTEAQLMGPEPKGQPATHVTPPAHPAPPAAPAAPPAAPQPAAQ